MKKSGGGDGGAARRAAAVTGRFDRYSDEESGRKFGNTVDATAVLYVYVRKKECSMGKRKRRRRVGKLECYESSWVKKIEEEGAATMGGLLGWQRRNAREEKVVIRQRISRASDQPRITPQL